MIARYGAGVLYARTNLPPDVLNLLLAYEKATKRTVKLDYIKCHALAQLFLRGWTGDDIANVVWYVKREIRAGENKGRTDGFKPASLEFGNLLGDTGRFEDRVLTAREEIARTRIVKGRRVLTSVEAGDMRTLVESEPVAEPTAAQKLVGAALMDLARKFL